MKEIQIECAPEALRLVACDDVKEAIRKRFKRILGPSTPQGQYIGIKLYPQAKENRLGILCYASFPMPHEVSQLVKDASLLTNLGAYEWDGEYFDICIPRCEITAHEALEQVTEIAEIRRKGRSQTRLMPA